MNTDYYKSRSLVDIEKELSAPVSSVVLNGTRLTLSEILSVAKGSKNVSLSREKAIQDRVAKSHEVMLRGIEEKIPIYGCNTSFGGQVKRILNGGGSQRRVRVAQALSAGLVHQDVSVGPTLSKGIIKAAVLIRVNMLLPGVSGIRWSTLESLCDLLRKDLTPVVHAYGSLGASGDLAQNQRVSSALQGLPHVRVINEKNKVESAKHAFKRHKLNFIALDPKEGLALVNGDNFSTAFALEVVSTLLRYYLISTVSSAMTLEVLRASNRYFHPILARLRPHPGQKEAADLYRNLLSGSRLAYQELRGYTVRNGDELLQNVYSLRCLAQFEGVMIEKLKWALDTITINANSVSDNPLWVSEDHTTPGEKPWQHVSGGNFLAMHMAEVLDTSRKIITQLIKKNDRHLARLIDPENSNGLSPNLSDPIHSVTACSLKGVQTLSGMLETYSMSLANPVTTLFGIHEQRNQDITSHAMTSGILALQNLELLKYSITGNLLAVAQAVDLRGGAMLLSPKTRPVYDFVRTYSKKVKKDRPLAPDLEKLSQTLEDGTLMRVIRERVFA